MRLNMKRNIFIIATMLLSCFVLSGCENENSEDIEIYNSEGITASYIEMDKKYNLKGYDKEYIDNGCIVHIYYEIKGA